MRDAARAARAAARRRLARSAARTRPAATRPSCPRRVRPPPAPPRARARAGPARRGGRAPPARARGGKDVRLRARRRRPSSAAAAATRGACFRLASSRSAESSRSVASRRAASRPRRSRSARASDSAARARTSASGAALVMTASAVFRPGKRFPVSFAEEPGPARDPRLTRAMLLSCSSRASTLASETLVPSARLASVASLARRDAGAGLPAGDGPGDHKSTGTKLDVVYMEPPGGPNPAPVAGRLLVPGSAGRQSPEANGAAGAAEARYPCSPLEWPSPSSRSRSGHGSPASLRKSDARAVAAHVAVDVPSPSSAARRGSANATTALGSNPHEAANANRGFPRSVSDTKLAHGARCFISATSTSSLHSRFSTRRALGRSAEAPYSVATALCDRLTCVSRAHSDMSPSASHALCDRSKVSRDLCASNPSTFEMQLFASERCASRMHPPSPAMAMSELRDASRWVRFTFCATSRRTRRFPLTFRDSSAGRCSSPESLSSALPDRFSARTCRVRCEMPLKSGSARSVLNDQSSDACSLRVYLGGCEAGGARAVARGRHLRRHWGRRARRMRRSEVRKRLSYKTRRSWKDRRSTFFSYH